MFTTYANKYYAPLCSGVAGPHGPLLVTGLELMAGLGESNPRLPFFKNPVTFELTLWPLTFWILSHSHSVGCLDIILCTLNLVA